MIYSFNDGSKSKEERLTLQTSFLSPYKLPILCLSFSCKKERVGGVNPTPPLLASSGSNAYEFRQITVLVQNKTNQKKI